MAPVEDRTGYILIGGGVGAGWVDGRINLVAGPLFAQIERERRDGWRYIEALRGARETREWAAASAARLDLFVPGDWVDLVALYRAAASLPATARERAAGIPEGWFGR